MKIKSWVFAALAMAVLWAGAFAIMKWIRSRAMDAEKVALYAQSADLDRLGLSGRTEFLEGLADRMNRLDFEERQKLQARRELEPLFRQMTEEERLQLLEQTLPEGFKQLMESLNKMSPEQRQRLVQRGLQNLKDAEKRYAENPEDRPGRQMDDATLQRFTQKGFESYLENASSETKMDMAPLLEQIQMNLQGLRGP